MEVPKFLRTAIEEPSDREESSPLVDKALKVRFSLIPAEELLEVAKVFTTGALKYSPHGWKGLSRELYLDAAYRHLNAYTIDTDNGELPSQDDETYLPKLAHAVASLLILMALDRNRV